MGISHSQSNRKFNYIKKPMETGSNFKSTLKKLSHNVLQYLSACWDGLFGVSTWRVQGVLATVWNDGERGEVKLDCRAGQDPEGHLAYCFCSMGTHT